MKLYSQSANIKAGLFLFGLLLIVSLLAFSQRIVNNLREDHREIVRLYSELIASASSQSDESLDFIFENIIKKVQFPLIQSDSDNIPRFHRNLSTVIIPQDELLDIMKTMDRQNHPIPLVYRDQETEIVFGYLHYGDNQLIQRLKWLPYIEISAVTLFILIGFIGFTVIRNNEKRFIWVGLARETAHQLGTPVSALMGWLDWLKENPDSLEKTIQEMETDVQRLDQIGDRFSKMGSKANLVAVNISEIVASVVQYLEKRLPSFGKKVTISNSTKANAVIYANEVLISWALENIVKNGIDAIDKQDGKLEIWTSEDSSNVFIYIKDNGKGISRKDRKNVFRPGFSSKERGWGLGLSLTQRIIKEIHRGDVTVMDSTPGKGTTFQITLPKQSASL